MASTDKQFIKPKDRSVLTSFKNAFSGIKYTFINERNFKIHTVVTLFVVTAGFVLSINKLEWLAVILCIGLVMAAELFNTATETVVDLIVGDTFHELARIAKDVAAAAVFLTAFLAVIIGVLVFLPYIWQIFMSFISE